MSVVKSNYWPPEVLDEYEQVDILGRGSFGDVWLAKQKEITPIVETTTSMKNIEKTKPSPCYVAVKFIKVMDKMTKAYAEREIAILSEMNHPFCIKLIKAYKIRCNARCVVLTLALGPTIDTLLKKGGAFGIPLATLITEQLVEVVAYLHSYAVLHRDLKPDNCVIVGGDVDDDSIWSDGEDAERFVKQSKWNLKLIDFGFARALRPHELLDEDKDAEELDTKENFKKDLPTTSLNLPLDASSFHGKSSTIRKKVSLPILKSIKSLSSSSSHGLLEHSHSKDILELSAVGSRGYAAPEIFKTIHKKNLKRSHFSSSYHGHIPNEALAENVSDYSMAVDAFSLGCILRHIWTGVPPNYSVEQYIAMEQAPFLIFVRFFSKCINSKEKQHRVQRLRHNDQVPQFIASIIRGLTESNVEKRITVRSCFRRLLPLEDDFDEKEIRFDLNKISFLECAKASKSKRNTK